MEIPTFPNPRPTTQMDTSKYFEDNIYPTFRYILNLTGLIPTNQVPEGDWDMQASGASSTLIKMEEL